MSPSFKEIGNRLRAYRLGRNFSPEEIATQLGISRAALYRYEKGVTPKLEVLEKIAVILDVSLPSLLGVGVEYITSCVTFLERMRQIELESHHISMLFSPTSYLLTSDKYDEVLIDVLKESIPNFSSADSNKHKLDNIIQLLSQRKKNYQQIKPNILNLVSAPELQQFIHNGFIGRLHLPESLHKQRLFIARDEVNRLIDRLEEQPIGVQIGLLSETIPNSGFQLFKQREKQLAATSPFTLGSFPNVTIGIATIASSTEAIGIYQEMIEQLWFRSLKSYDAIDYIRKEILITI